MSDKLLRLEEVLSKRGVVAAVSAGLVAAWAVPSRFGLGTFLIAAAVATAVPFARAVRIDEAAFGLIALALCAPAVFRAAGWVVLLSLCVAAGVACVAVTSASTWRAIVEAPVRVASAVSSVMAGFRKAVGDIPDGTEGPAFGGLFRAGGVSVVLLIVFGTLFISADAAFARLASDVLLPEIAFASTAVRVATFVVVAMFSGAAIVARYIPAAESGSWSWKAAARDMKTNRDGRSLFEWVVPIAALDLLFAAFVAVQMTVLFGGRHHVEVTPGLTYAEYARQGFFQLLAVAVLVLIVIATTVQVAAARTQKERFLAKGTLGLLCLLTLVVLASAWYRLGVYEGAYGLTRLRVSVYAAIAWLALTFLLVIAAGAVWRALWLPRAALAITAAGVVLFALADPDALIARRNVARYEQTGVIDVRYLASLSEDAVPALTQLPTPIRDCVLGHIATRVDPEEGGWTDFNLGRDRARDHFRRFDIAGATWPECLAGR